MAELKGKMYQKYLYFLLEVLLHNHLDCDAKKKVVKFTTFRLFSRENSLKFYYTFSEFYSKGKQNCFCSQKSSEKMMRNLRRGYRGLVGREKRGEIEIIGIQYSYKYSPHLLIFVPCCLTNHRMRLQWVFSSPSILS